MTARKASYVPFAALLAAACSSTPGPALPERPRGKVALEVRGDFKGSPREIGEGDLAALPSRKVKGTDPVTGRAAEWEGADLSPLVRAAMEGSRGGGREARAGPVDTVVIRTADGAAVPVSLSQFMQYRPILTTRADGAALEAPRLAWPNDAQPGLLRDPRHRAWWATRPTALEVVRWPRAYGRALSTPQGASAAARRGGGLFAARCVTCHAVRGAGGTNAPELTAWGGAHDLGALSAKLADHPGRLADDLEQDFVVPLHAYLAAMAKAPPLEPLPEPGKEGEKPRPQEDEGDLDGPPGPPGDGRR